MQAAAGAIASGAVRRSGMRCFCQVRLVATHRVALHRSSGPAYFLPDWSGTRHDSLHRLQRDLLADPDSNRAFLLLAFQLFAIVLDFVILVSLAIYSRRRSDYHKRFMVLAMLSVQSDSRVPVPFIPNHDISVAILLTFLAC